MKRGRGDSVTGGTGDYSPQLLTVAITMTGANTYTESSIPLPQNRFQIKKGKSIVVEVLKTIWDLPVKDNNPGAAGEASLALAQLSTISLAAISSAETHVFAYAQKEYRGAFTAAGSYAAVIHEPFVLDTTDGAGHGFLVATDNIFLAANTSNFTAAATMVCKILYRFKEIGLEEYIGIVQGQQ